ncbi:MAG: uncharacterized protein KVP18_003560 [Porospora cf. gigantea A]|uniref:uncharacterized protein n=1 Tax=Porospora cf. gigantea A TaxID=2853593 RepID=UPI003559BA05|nr:MAG: hypothetical protein KVP18_003560 [Porospora cf. gigantea A]
MQTVQLQESFRCNRERYESLYAQEGTRLVTAPQRVTLRPPQAEAIEQVSNCGPSCLTGSKVGHLSLTASTSQAATRRKVRFADQTLEHAAMFTERLKITLRPPP